MLATFFICLYCTMFLKRFIITLVICLSAGQFVAAQSSDVCNAITAILRDAPNQFRNIKGRMIESNMNATMWAAGIVVPGSIGTRFVASMGLFYECAFYQTRSREELKPHYEKYKALLTDCLAPQGYTLFQHDNFYPGMGDYKKLVFMQEDKEIPITDSANNHISAVAPPHITLEADYSKETGKYTVLMIIFEH